MVVNARIYTFAGEFCIRTGKSLVLGFPQFWMSQSAFHAELFRNAWSGASSFPASCELFTAGGVTVYWFFVVATLRKSQNRWYWKYEGVFPVSTT